VLVADAEGTEDTEAVLVAEHEGYEDTEAVVDAEYEAVDVVEPEGVGASGEMERVEDGE
jgi:hypothetical protein